MAIHSGGQPPPLDFRAQLRAAIVDNPELSLGELARRFRIRPESVRRVRNALRADGVIPPFTTR